LSLGSFGTEQRLKLKTKWNTDDLPNVQSTDHYLAQFSPLINEKVTLQNRPTPKNWPEMR